ncbi:hypothetical protein BDZ90DRAFT_277454 [Jaminaea rosea]|uniref:Uncharacterized protein n=1 Tax=Jaminaea rosea TaxID=1569628 RepID=A0A316V0H3_9BASI|nr:hypothetical protein BDZ90DRAFT_277454 [Jaminaea rosea]PWN31046.1 hypothetical protein BDZ90DRAFT_277454 [Jaminaea rosea]
MRMIRTVVARASRSAATTSLAPTSAASSSSSSSHSISTGDLSQPSRLPSDRIHVTHFHTGNESPSKLYPGSGIYQCPAFRLERRHYTKFTQRLFPSFLPRQVTKETHTTSKLRDFIPGADGKSVAIMAIKSKKSISNDAVLRQRAARRVFWALNYSDVAPSPTPPTSSWSSPRESEASNSTDRSIRPPRDIAAHATSDRPRKNKRPPPWTPSDALEGEQHWICIKGMPPTATPADVVRVLDSTSSTASAGGSPSSSVGLSRFISDVLPVYRPTSLRGTDRFLLRLLHERHLPTILHHLNGRLYAGHELSALKYHADGAGTLLGSNLVACSSKAYNPQAHGSVTDFVRAIVARSSAASSHSTTNDRASGWGTSSGGSGSVVLLRGLPPGVRPELLVRRFGRRYTLAAPGGPRNRTSLWDKRIGSWAPVQLEQIIQLWAASSATEAREARAAAAAEAASNGSDVKDLFSSPFHASTKTTMFLIRLASPAHAHALVRRLHARRWNVMPASARYGGSDAQGERNYSYSRPDHPEGEGLLLGDIEGYESREGVEGEVRGGHDSFLDEVDEYGLPLYSDAQKDSASGAGSGAANGRIRQRYRAREGEVVSGMREYVVEVQVMY